MFVVSDYDFKVQQAHTRTHAKWLVLSVLYHLKKSQSIWTGIVCLIVHNSIQWFSIFNLVRGLPSFSSFSRSYKTYDPGEGVNCQCTTFKCRKNDDFFGQKSYLKFGIETAHGPCWWIYSTNNRQTCHNRFPHACAVRRKLYQQDASQKGGTKIVQLFSK